MWSTYIGESKVKGKLILTRDALLFLSKNDVIMPLKDIKDGCLFETNDVLEIEMQNGDVHKLKVYEAIRWLEKIERIKRSGEGDSVIKWEKGKGYENSGQIGNIHEGLIPGFKKVCAYMSVKRIHGMLQISSRFLIFTSKNLELYIPFIDMEESIIGYKADYLEIHMNNGDLYEFNIQAAKDWVWKIRELKAIIESVEHEQAFHDP